MDPNKGHELHSQLRENTEELSDYIRDLNNWLKDIKKTDEELRMKQQQVEAHDYPPIRNGPSSESKTKKKHHNDRAVVMDNKTIDEESDTDSDEIKEHDSKRMMEIAEMEKNKGNQFFKEGKYNEAIECYSKGIMCDPANAILPANRAMALMKTGQFAAAEVDCKLSINLDSTYVKAFHRRGTCRFALKKYQLARQDFLKVMELDPGNKHAKAELDKLEKIFRSINSKDPLSTQDKLKVLPAKNSSTDVVTAISKPSHLQSKKPLKRIKIEPTNDDENEEIMKSPQELVKAEAITNTSKLVKKPVTMPIEELVISPISAPPLPSIPHTAFQFLSDWKKLHNFPELQHQYIKQFPPTKLPKIFKEAIESEILSDILHVLEKNVPEFGNETILSYLQNIPEVGRFKTVVMFLSDEEKKGIKTLVEGVSNGRSDIASDLLRLYRIA